MKEMKMSEKKMNLYQKLIEVRKEVLYLQKDQSGYKYKYANEGSILEKIRPVMDKLGVFLEVDVPQLEIKTSEISFIAYNEEKKPVSLDKKTIFLHTTMKFIWIDSENPTDRIEKTIKLCESGDIDIKKCGSLMTYGTKYFLFKFFNIETGEDDPDSRQEQKMTKDHIDELVKLYKEKGSKELFERHLKGHCVSHLREIDDSQFPILFYWITKFHETKELNEGK